MGRRRKPKDDLPKIGSNGGQITDENRKKLQGFIAEIERLEDQRREIKQDIDTIFASAKDTNFDVTAMRVVLKERRMDRAKREARDAILDAYRHALGMLSDTPLGQAAIERAAEAA